MEEICLFCGESLKEGGQPTCTVSRGIETIIQRSLENEDGLHAKLVDCSSIVVHTNCRKNYTRPAKKLSSTVKMGPEKPNLRSEIREFDFKTDCFFCGEEASSRIEKNKGVKNRRSIYEVRTIEMRDNVISRALERGDEWGEVVLARASSVIDFVAAEAKYHKPCYARFFNDKISDKSQGRPETEENKYTFDKLCEFLYENEECQFSLAELEEKLNQEGNHAYTRKRLKEKLKNAFGDNVTITELPGKNGVVSFRDTAQKILHNKWYTEKASDVKSERKRIVETAAAIVREDVRSYIFDAGTYPPASSLKEAASEMIPDTLKCFVDGVTQPRKGRNKNSDRKSETIQHEIMAASRPRSFVSPILLSVAVYIHRKYSHKDLINLLHNIGVSESYAEAIRYENSLLLDSSTHDNTLTEGFMQYAFDNADFNTNTLDGHNTFHTMGGIRCVTPVKNTESNRPVPRYRENLLADAIGTFGDVPIQTYKKPETPGLKQIAVRNLSLYPEEATRSLRRAMKLDSLWLAGCAIEMLPKPSWAGFMEAAMQDSGQYAVSSVHALPFINLDPTKPSAIYTALMFADSECKRNNKTSCIVTFDQPLYQKASEIVASSPGDLGNVIVRLGGFHLLMSFMGAVGNIMAGSGLEELWSTVYAPSSVSHMITGHAYSRALRAHFLTQEALATILLKSSAALDETSKENLRQLYTSLLGGSHLEEAFSSADVSNLYELEQEICQDMKDKSRTNKLWIQYFELVQIMRLFVRAERAGDWYLHLYAVKQMLPYLHAAGHLAYAKSAHLYVQQMEELTPEVRQIFVESGYFTIRRSDKFWSGVWSDMTIEQVLMRAIKTSGGLTGGRGISDSTLTRWIKALPLTVALCNSLEDFAGVVHETSEQHKELRPSRQTKDNEDVNCFIQWFTSHSPFGDRPVSMLVSLSTGVIADESVNCDNAFSVGIASQESMAGKMFSEVKLQRKTRIRPIASMNNSIKVRGKEVVIQPQQMLNRILSTLDSATDLAKYLKYELAPRPPSLFDDTSLRRPTKAALASLLLSFLPPAPAELPQDPMYVIDGGHLLHHVVWPCSGTYADVCQMYVNHVQRFYGRAATVIFDGYAGPPSTKSEEQKRRAAKCTSADIDVAGHIKTTVSQAAFLGNPYNKQGLINALIDDLQAAGIVVKQAIGDADTLIVSTALHYASESQPTVVIGTDTDLLVMLVARTPPDCNIWQVNPGSSKTQQKAYNVPAIQKELGSLKDNLLFLHAATGSDTTSAPYQQGKKKGYKTLKKNDDLAQTVKIFNIPEADAEDIAKAGEMFLLALYGASAVDTLDDFRFATFKKKNAKKLTSSVFQMANLPPTSAAARQHSFRTYCQVQQWMENDIDPTKWGWVLANGSLLPVPTYLPSAPDKLLHVMSCNCKAGCTGACGCRRAGMPCSTICSCVGVACSNPLQQCDCLEV